MLLFFIHADDGKVTWAPDKTYVKDCNNMLMCRSGKTYV